MSRTYSAPKRLLYFGACPEAHSHHRLGHYVWTPACEPRGAACRVVDESPWPMLTLDQGLCPGGVFARGHSFVDAAKQVQGAALLHHRAGWTALAFWDRTGDPRPGSNSAFIGEGISSACAMLDAARAAFPSVMARLDAAGVHVAIDSHAQELLEAAGRIGGGP